MINELLPILLKEAEKYGVKPQVDIADGIQVRIKKEDVEKLLQGSIDQQYRGYVTVKAEGDIVITIKMM